MGTIGENIAVIQERISAAARRAGRDPGEITLVVVTKKQPLALVQEALEAGTKSLGENYVQEAVEKQLSLSAAGMDTPQWHLIGHLQSNKAPAAVQAFDLIQSVDSTRLARILGQEAQRRGKTQRILLQVHLGQEETKYGLPTAKVINTSDEVGTVPGIVLQGLMGIAPAGENPRSYFRELRQLYDQLPPPARQILSMGMTGDFETAIEEGATMVRVGTAIFGPRPA